ncbi:hypothetical protein EUTSA_v10026804mg [Eutrema salsugineum]|uniref:Retrotransposon gag domain-containing protein n=1 Tax=Eutrema salsugineum TaxID=72664 RepID=V4MSL1_EUTSA|nr:hypothetical protein EUTSA_v10026804mg [Eutrema salsugineum]
MSSTKDRVKMLERSMGMMQDEMQKMRVSLEESMGQIMEAIAVNRESDPSGRRGSRRSTESPPHTSIHRGDNENPFAAATVHQNRYVKIDFPRFSGGDPTEWLSRVKQYFEYHEMPRDQLVRFTSFHLDGVANECGKPSPKLSEGTRFISHGRVWQTGSLREYQEEFERLQKKVHGWPQAALVGTFMGGLHSSIADGIRMFRPKTLKEMINYARLQDGQLQRQKKGPAVTMSNSRALVPVSSPTQSFPNHESPTKTPKKLTWEQLKMKRSLGLCFSCDERYTPGHKCQKPQLLLMEGGETSDEEEAHDPGI